MSEQEFKPIPGLEKYEVSKDGRIRHVETKRTVSQNLNTTGYLQFSYYKDNKSSHMKVHRAVMNAWRPSQYPNDKIIHIDKEKLNNNIDNLIWASEQLITEEEFRPIEIAPGYEISRSGIVRNIERRQVIKPVVHFGYVRVPLWIDGKAIHKSLHRMLMMAYVPNPDNLPHVNHIDSNPLNNSLDNLEWCTCQQNVIHSFEHGYRTNKGEKNPTSKLKESDVIQIRQLIAEGVGQPEIAKQFHINSCTVSAINTRRLWSHVA